MTPRTGTRALASLVALALVVGAVVVGVEIVAAWTGHDPWLVPRDRWLTELRTRSWDDPAVRAVFAAGALAGLAVFAAQAWPRRPSALAVAAPDESSTPPLRVAADIERRAVESRAQRAAATVDGVRRARARVRRRDVLVDVDTRRKYSSLEGAVRERVEVDLARIRLQRPRPVRVRVRRVRDGRV